MKISREALKKRNECLNSWRSKYKVENKYNTDFWKQHTKNKNGQPPTTLKGSGL